MLNADDPESVLALRALASTAATGTRPIVFWVGAGASRWLGYASWKDLTLQLRRVFFKEVPNFDNQRAVELINRGQFPAIFQMCKDLDPPRYYRFIAGEFLPKRQTGVYESFASLLRKINPQFLVTTNVDEALESAMPTCVRVQRTDISRSVDLLQKRTPFIAKLHGSVSSVQSTVFATSEYATLVADTSYLQTLKYIFTGCTVVFLGYGVRDDYVIRLLQQNAAEMALFGPGPHFVVTNDPLPLSSLHRIRYVIKLHPDHKAALSVLDHVIQSLSPGAPVTVVADGTLGESPKPGDVGTVPPGQTAYYISDLTAPGTWQTSQEITAADPDGKQIEGAVGMGFTNDEVPFRESTALHDTAVGLICFDYVYLPLSALDRAFSVFGEDLFRELVKQDALRFIHDVADAAILFEPKEAIGTLASLTLRTKHGTGPELLGDRIRRVLKPVPGREKEAEELLGGIERRTTVFLRANEIDLTSLARGALLMPAVSRLLGIGDAIRPTQAPRWLRYPYLRMAHLVQTAALCTEYGIQAAKLPFGGAQLTSAAFGVQPAEMCADQLASYVASGVFNSDLGAILAQDMSIMKKILRFRESAEGKSFRLEIGQALSFATGREFNASVNAGLSRTIPLDLLQRAHDGLLKLVTENARVTPVPAVWNDARQSDGSTRHWRSRSRRMLLEMCSARKIGNNDPCICGSGDKLHLCCLAPLRD